MPALIDLTNVRFGRLTVIKRVRRKEMKRETFWLCGCDCGATSVVAAPALKTGNTKSCGCLRSELVPLLSRTHGYTADGRDRAEYNAWRNMKYRCLNPNCDKYKFYGGRGITVCARWLDSFENFIADMGVRPSAEHSLDRYPDMNGNYEPGNCRWATKKQQTNNRRERSGSLPKRNNRGFFVADKLTEASS